MRAAGAAECRGLCIGTASHLPRGLEGPCIEILKSTSASETLIPQLGKTRVILNTIAKDEKTRAVRVVEHLRRITLLREDK